MVIFFLCFRMDSYQHFLTSLALYSNSWVDSWQTSYRTTSSLNKQQNESSPSLVSHQKPCKSEVVVPLFVKQQVSERLWVVIQSFNAREGGREGGMEGGREGGNFYQSDDIVLIYWFCV